MSSGSFPTSQKTASITPILKKATLDPYDLSNYRPISNLTFRTSHLRSWAARVQVMSWAADPPYLLLSGVRSRRHLSAWHGIRASVDWVIPHTFRRPMTYKSTDRRLRRVLLILWLVCRICIECVTSWMSSNRLRLNPSKTELIWLGTSRRLQHCDGFNMTVCGADVRPVDCVPEILVSWSTATWHFRITSTMWLASAFISYASYVSSDGPWRQMLHTRWFGPWSTPKSTTVTDSWLPFLSTCTRSYSPSSVPPPDLFCSSHIIGLFPELREDSCTARFVSDSNCVPLYTDVCTDSLLPTCLISVRLHAHLRSSVTLERSLSIPRTKTKTLGPLGFYFASSAAWNALPVHLRDPELSLNSFKTKLKTHFFSWPHLGYIYHLICSSCAPTR